jgi:hypothetical protein
MFSAAFSYNIAPISLSIKICKTLPYIAKTKYRNLEIFPEKEYRGLSPNFHIHAPVSDLYIPTIGLPTILLEEKM